MDQLNSTVTAILEEWKITKPKLEELFRKRDQKSAKQFMEKGIFLFKQFLFITNDLPVSIEQTIPYQQLTYKPVNLEERLEFIGSRPHLHHAYRQLAELMVELEKMYVKKQLQKNRPAK
ncbi:hypothetical protein RCG24_03045 [Neobacillus sp. OS1-32]|uniref:YpoC-like domain-containing protein n=1 Tax=Neobacillus paridis TaxID=2803862 RepID=A0ABS1TS76_9BACI|nr:MULTISPECIES: hypothetical protein [Neobacillus]MBL4954170.1 hypothetical protein [Neobacillus paridis]WML30897.1 hypothetical protein RCG24_03045 [Neobacillus sp. OS1-32]